MEIMDRVKKAVNHEEVYPVPVVFWDLAPWMPSMFHVNVKEYYQNSPTKLAVQSKLQKTFPEAMFYPGLHPDFGVIAQASAYGGKIHWFDDDAPYIHPSLEKIEDIRKLKSADPHADGLLPEVLKEWKFFLKNGDRHLLKKYGYVHGHALVWGPAETAGLILGYEKIFMGYYEQPDLVHRFMEFLTEEAIKWAREQEKITGKLERLFIADHLSAQLSPVLYDEFFHPYLKAVFYEFKEASVRLWHNEGRSSHVYNRIPDLGCNIYNFGEDPMGEIKKTIGDKVCLMGNLDSVKVIRNGSNEMIAHKVQECIHEGAKGGGLLISGTGGLAPGTRVEKVQAVMDAVKRAEKNPGID